MEGMCHGVALFGTGRIGKVHLKDIVANQRLKILYLIEANISIARSVHKDFALTDEVKVLDIKDAEVAYSDASVKCVLICTPSKNHETIIRGALDGGKAVFCEKPLALDNSSVDKCFQMAQERGQILFCAFNRHFDPQVRELYNKVQEGQVGKLRVVKITSRDSVVNIEYVKESGGIFVDAAVHDIDLLCWLVGETPSRVYATGHATDPAYAECDDVDTCNITLTFPGGTIGNIEVSRNSCVGYDQRIEVFGRNGMLTSGNHSATTLVFQNLSGVVHSPIYECFLDRYYDSYRLELEHFVDIIEGKTHEEITGISVQKANLVAEACGRSLRSGQAVEFKL